ncbi:MAG: TIR domain-containing protein [Oscillospiraceae bacterium]|nr:TIR domain-containing protein [Oscillospiraceae bacterium]
MPEFKYDAFISYRHLSPDREIAKQLHTAIETYRIPGAVQRTAGIKRFSRAFRDEEELPLSSDLSTDIKQALKDSRWLIVVCSPQLLKSRWCMEEINTFIALGRREWILAVLVEGEPTDSFPPQLRFEQTGDSVVEKEPLAADLRADTAAGRAKRLRTEKLRLFAPMLGVDYDDLKQRARERRLRVTLALSAAALVLISAFSVYAVVQNRRIAAEKSAAQKSQSLYLSDASQTALDGGDRLLATLLALQALPEDPDDPDRPLTAEAEAALRSASISGQATQGYAPTTTFEADDSAIAAYTVNGSGKFMRLFGQKIDNYIATFQQSNGERLFAEEETRILLEGSIRNCVFISGLYPVLFYDGRMDYYGSNASYKTGAESFELPEGDFTLYEGWQYIVYYTRDSNLIFFGRNNTDSLRYGMKEVTELEGVSSIKSVRETRKGTGGNIGSSEMLVGCHGDGDVCTLYLFKMESGAQERAYDITQDIDFVDTSSDGTAVCAVTEYWSGKGGEVYIFNAYTGEEAYVITPDMTDGTGALEAWFTNGADNKIAVRTYAGSVYVFDYARCEPLFSLSAGTPSLLSVRWNTGGTRLLCACSDNCARLFSAETGEQQELLEAQGSLTSAVYYSSRCLNATDRCILLVGEKTIQWYELLSEAGGGQSSVTALGGVAASMAPTYMKVSPDSKRIACVANGILNMYRAEDGALLWTANDYITLSTVYGGEMAFSPDSGTLIYSTGNPDNIDFSFGFIAVDALTGEKLGEFEPKASYVYYTKPSGELERNESDTFNCAAPLFNGSGSSFIVVPDRLTYAEAVFVYDAATLEERWRFVYEETDDSSWYGVEGTQGYTGSVDVDSLWLDDGRVLIEMVLRNKGGTYWQLSDRPTEYCRYYEIRSAATGEVLSKCSVFYGGADDAELSSDGRLLMVVGADGAAIYSTESGEEMYFYPEAAGRSVYWTGDGSGIMFRMADGRKLIRTLGKAEAYDATDDALTWNRAALFDFESTKNNYDATSTYFVYNDSTVASISSMPFGAHTVALEVADGKNRLTDLLTGETVVTLADGVDIVTIYAAAPDGSFIVYATSRDKGIIKLLRATPLPELMEQAKRTLGGRALTDDEKTRYFIVEG